MKTFHECLLISENFKKKITEKISKMNTNCCTETFQKCFQNRRKQQDPDGVSSKRKRHERILNLRRDLCIANCILYSKKSEYLMAFYTCSVTLALKEIQLDERYFKMKNGIHKNRTEEEREKWFRVHNCTFQAMNTPTSTL